MPLHSIDYAKAISLLLKNLLRRLLDRRCGVLGLGLEGLFPATEAVIKSASCFPRAIDISMRVNVLPVAQVTVALRSLCGEVDQVAAKEEVVLRADGQGVAHEDGGVAGQGSSHGTGNAVAPVSTWL